MGDLIFLNGVLTLIDELKVLKNYLEGLHFTPRSSESILVDALKLKIDDLLKDADDLLNRPRGSEADQHKLKILKRQRDMLAHIYESVNHHLKLLEASSLEYIFRFKSALFDHAAGLVHPYTKVVLLLSSQYKMTDILADKSVYVVAMPIYDIVIPWYWILLSHELGHVFYAQNRTEIEGANIRNIVKYLAERAPTTTRTRDDFRSYIRLWREHWLQELISDLFACALLGTSYTIALIDSLQDPEAGAFSKTHPPLSARIHIQLYYLNAIVPELARECERYWKSFEEHFCSKSFNYPFGGEILENIVQSFKDILPNPPVFNILNKVKEFRKELESNNVPETGDVLSMICALALSNNKLKIREQFMKTITEDR